MLIIFLIQFFDILIIFYIRKRTINVNVLIEPAPIDSVICGCCNQQMTPTQHENHLNSKAQERWRKHRVTEPEYQKFKRKTNFLKTKIMFKNGLVAFNQNLIATEIGGYKKFMDLFEDKIPTDMEVDDSD